MQRRKENEFTGKIDIKRENLFNSKIPFTFCSSNRVDAILLLPFICTAVIFGLNG